MVADLSLWSVFEDYVLIRRLAPTSEYELRRVLTAFGRWLGRDPGLLDLDDVLVSQWIHWLESMYSPRGVANHRTSLLCLWRFAAERLGIRPPSQVRRAPRPDPCPIAWTADELGCLLDRCRQLRGIFRRTGASRSAYCETLVRFCYESGLRRSDVWRVRREQIRPDGTIVGLRQHKTGYAHWPKIRPPTIAGIASLPGDPPLRCPYSSPTDFYHFWRADVIAAAGIRRGALQQLRRTGATLLAIDHPEAVQRYLGHRSPTMQRHYVDQSIAAPQQWLPPDVDSACESGKI
jgi:integrase